VLGNLTAASNDLMPAMTHRASASDTTRLAVSALGRLAPRRRTLLKRSRQVRSRRHPLHGPLRDADPTDQPACRLPCHLRQLPRLGGLSRGLVRPLRRRQGPPDPRYRHVRADSVSNVSRAERAAINALAANHVLEPFVGKTGYNPYPPGRRSVVLWPLSGTYPRIQEDPPTRSGARDDRSQH
jgi:hypothetical protein